MANEFQHKSVGSQISQSEFESTDGTGHVFDSQAAGDLAYASSTTVLSRLGIGTAGKVLMVNSGATAPEWQNAITGVTSILNTALVIGRDADNDIDFATDNTILFRADGADQIKLTNGALLPVTDDDIDLGSSSLQFKDGHFDGTVEADAITVGGTAVVTSGAVTSITSLLATDIKIGEDDQTKIDFETADEIHFYAANVEQVYLADNIFGPQSDSDVDLGTTGVRWKDAYIDTVTTTGDVTVGGDLTITGDDLVMGTNTSGMLLIADGTNFNPTAVGSLSEISSIADDDVFLAVDTSGGGLKKVARSQVVSGLATSSGIASVANDSTPELGGDLDVLTNSIVTGASNRNIKLAPHGTGLIEVRGNTNPGSIILNCESNSHGQTIKAQAHSEAVTNTLTLPAGSSSTLVSLVSTDTLTNKTLTTPKIAEIDSLSSGNIVLDAEANIELNADGGTITFKDASASLGTITSSGYSGTAAVATTVTITDNESTDEDNAIIFTAGGDVDGGDIGLESDGTLTYNPSTGKVTATGFVGTLTGNVTGNTSGTAATVTSGTQANITTLANLTTSGALNAGSITSGFGTIDTGSSAISTTGAVRTGDINLGHASDTTLARSASGEVTIEGSLIKKAGVENIWVPAQAMTPRDNAGCADLSTVAAGTNGRPDFHVLDFDKDSDEHAQFSIAMPKSWDGGNVNAYFYWIGIAATTGVAWGTQVLSLNDNEEIDAAYGTAVVTQDDSQGDATELLISAKSGDIACSGADGDLLYFQVFRDVSDGNDDMAGDARLVGILFEYTSSASTDG
tara:strand:+ start:3654 stop:6047 length:2394 start_codon:yes stop_codon:yes gene_type:complete